MNFVNLHNLFLHRTEEQENQGLSAPPETNAEGKNIMSFSQSRFIVVATC